MQKWVIVFFTLLTGSLYAQKDTNDVSDAIEIPGDVDSAFAIARDYAYDGEYEKARTILTFFSRRYPGYKGLSLFNARTYLYEKEYKTAAKLARSFDAKDTASYIEAKRILLLAKKYDKQFDTALVVANSALKDTVNDEFFQTQRAQILKDQKEFKESLNATDTGLKYHPKSNELQQLRSYLLNQLVADGVAVGINHDNFSTPATKDWWGGFAQIGKYTKSGTYIGRVNYANRFGNQNGIQLEGEAYPRFRTGQYMYLNLAISGSNLFPVVKGGAEFYTPLPNAFEGSIGFRYFDFRDTSKVWAFTGSLGWYNKTNYYMYRPYFINQKLGWAVNHNFLFRHFSKGSASYFQIIAGFGFIPDQRLIVLNNQQAINTFYTQNQYVGAAYQKFFNSKVYGRGSITLTRQEDGDIRDTFYQIYSFELVLGFRF